MRYEHLSVIYGIHHIMEGVGDVAFDDARAGALGSCVHAALGKFLMAMWRDFTSRANIGDTFSDQKV